MEIKEKNFLKKVWTSIRDFEGYEEFAAGKITKAIQYMLILTSIFVVVIVAIYTYKFNLGIQEVRNYVDQNIEQIKYENRKTRNIIRRSNIYRRRKQHNTSYNSRHKRQFKKRTIYRKNKIIQYGITTYIR